MNIQNLIALGVASAPAQKEQLEAVSAILGFELPAPLRDLYESTDGFITPGGAQIYDAESLVERNETYEIRDYCPGYFLIGDDSGGRGFLLALSADDRKVYGSDFGDLHPRYFSEMAPSLEDFVAQLRW